jgi:hypothetical protein
VNFKEEQAEEKSEEEEIERAISGGQQEMFAAATQEGHILPRQNLPTPLIVRKTFIEAPIALPLSSRFSRLRRATSCPAEVQCGAAEYYSMLALEESEDEAAAVAAGTAPQSSGASWMLQMHMLELATMSVGSVNHDSDSRRCKPCAFVHTDAGCANGAECSFCHACGPGEKRRRQKAKVQRRKQRLCLHRQAAEGKEVTAQLQFATRAVHTKAYQPVTEYQHHVSMQADGSCCLLAGNYMHMP